MLPAATPVTIPVDPMDATDVLALLHVPPLTLLLRVVVIVAHTEDAPEMLPAFGKGFTVTILVA